MKILLLMPHPNAKKSIFNKFSYPCLTLQQVAGITPPEHDVEIIDERFENIKFNKHYDLVGISLLTYNSLRGYELSNIFRKKGITVVLGGYHPSLLPEEAKKHADAIVVGEAEHSWPQLLSDFQKGKLKPLYKGEKPKAEEIPPARHNIGVYTLFSESIQSTRGCPVGCEWCAMNVMEGKIVRCRPVQNVIDEMKTIKAKNIFFADASVTVNPSYSKRLFKGMSELNKRFQCFGNINVVARDDEFLKLANEAGIMKWYLGIESISQKNIDQAGKGTNKVKQYEKAIKKIKDYGMEVCGFFIFGLDYDTPEIFDLTLDSMIKWGLDEASFSIITPYPGTRLFERMNKEGRITSYDWSRYQEGKVNITHPKMSEQDILQGIRRIALEFYSTKNTIRRTINGNGFNPNRLIRNLIGSAIAKSFYKREKLDFPNY